MFFLLQLWFPFSFVFHFSTQTPIAYFGTYAVFGGKSFIPHVQDFNFASVSFDLTGHLINKTKLV